MASDIISSEADVDSWLVERGAMPIEEPDATFGRTGEVGAVELGRVEGCDWLLAYFPPAPATFVIDLELEASMSEILDMWNESLSMTGDVPRKDDEGDGRG